MRLPYIKIEYREEETYALGKISVSLIIGFAMYWTWVYAVLFNGSLLFFPRAAEIQQVLFPTSIAAFVATLLAYGMFLELARRLFDTKRKRSRNRLAAAIFTSLGMVLMIAGNAVPGMSPVIGLAAGVFLGVGAAILLMSYGVSFSVCDLPTIAFCTAVSLPAAAIAFVVIMLLDLVSHPLGAIICLTLPFFQLLCLRKCSENLVDKLEFKALTIPVRTAPFALHIFLPSMVFGVLLGLARSCTIAMPTDIANLEGVAVAVALAAVFVFGSIMFAMFTQRQSNNFAFRTLVPVAAVLLSILVVPGVLGSSLSVFCLFATYLIVEACMWIMHSDISQRFRISAFTVFGFGRAALGIGAFIGYECSLPTGPLGAISPGTAPFLVIALVACTFGVALLPTNHELRRVLRVGQNCPALLHEEDYVLDALDAASATLDADAASMSATLAAAVGSRSTEEADGRRRQQIDDRHVGTPPVLHPEAMENLASEAADGQRSEAEIQRNAGWFKRKCSVIADRYLLSRREAEVLFLLAKGRSSTTIQENLYISEGTANTHMRHIYRKLDVHSQRELMDLVEMVELDDDRS